MDLDLINAMKIGALKVGEYLNEESIERVLGDGMMYYRSRESKNLKSDDYLGYEKLLVEDTTENLYRLIATNQVFFAKAISNKELKKPENVKGFSQNMKKIYESLLDFETNVDTAVKMGLDYQYILFRDENVRKDFKDFMRFLKEIMPFFDKAPEIERVCKKNRYVSDEFFAVIPELNKGVRETLVSGLQYIGDWSEFGSAFQDAYMTIMNHFDSNSKYIDSQKLVYETAQAVQKAQMEERKQNAKAPEMSEVEKERRLWIQKANDLYDELCLDFMRDLEKQYSTSTKDMYDYFVNVKFKKFVERFHMPLDKGVSVGQAKEACGQIQNLMDYISKISENAYTIGVYDVKEK